MMAFTFSGFGSIPRLIIMNPKNIPIFTTNVHFFEELPQVLGVRVLVSTLDDHVIDISLQCDPEEFSK